MNNKITYLLFLSGIFFLPAFYCFGEGGKQDASKGIKKGISKMECLEMRDSLLALADELYYFDALQSLNASEELLRLADICGEEEIYFSAYLSLSWAYLILSNFPESVKYGEKALQVAETIKNVPYKIEAYNLLGNIYLEVPDKDFAINYFNKGIVLAKKINDESSLSSFYNNIAVAYEQFDDLNASLEYYLKAKAIYEKSDNERDKGLIYLNIGDLYRQTNHLDSAGKYQEMARKYLYYKKDCDFLSILYTSIANKEAQRDNYPKALLYLDSCFLCLGAGHAVTDYLSYHKTKAEILIQSGNSKAAYEDLLKAFDLKDSILTNEVFNKLRDIQIATVSAKKESEIQTLVQEKEIQDLKISENKAIQKNFILIFITISTILVFLVFLVINNRRNNNKLKIRSKTIEKQSALIADKNLQLEQFNKEVIDSINYAKRLQEAILPSRNFVKEYLPDSFILYRPKDIVAGDFYWMEVIETSAISSSRENGSGNQLPTAAANCQFVFLAAADCTGHGVPGAMLSVVCSNALNRTVKEFGITEPGKILDKVRELVIETFTSSARASGEDQETEGHVKDGMDISLCCLELKDFNGSAGSAKLQWAGANNPLWVIRENNLKTEAINEAEIGIPIETDIQIKSNRYQLIELKPNKQAIGQTDNPQPFTTQTMALQKGDTLFLNTDGFADQFGGAKGKKFKKNNLKKTILEMSHLPLEEQSQLLNQKFDQWKGNLEQVDDVCIIGVRI